MIEATSCGGVVIFRGKILLLYKNYRNKYEGKSQYTCNTAQDLIVKDVHWYLMMSDSYHSRPQREEYFVDSGYYKYHEAYHLLKFTNEKQILEKAYSEYIELKKSNLWGSKKYF